MRRAAKFIGTVGGVLGIVLGFSCALIFALIGQGDRWVFVGLAVGALVLGGAGIVGRLLADTHRIASVALLAIPGILGFWCLGLLWTLPGVLLIIASILESRSWPRPIVDTEEGRTW
jgi:hypothetical protein